MAPISQAKKEVIYKHILNYLFLNKTPQFTKYIAESIGRDEEFTKDLLMELRARRLVSLKTHNNSKSPYRKWKLWKITNLGIKRI